MLGGPLAFTTWRLVEDFTHAELAGRLRQVVNTLDAQVQSERPVDLAAVSIAVPPGGSLVVRTPRGTSAIGDTTDATQVAETLPFGLAGSAVLSEPAAEMRARQLQATALVLSAVLLSVAVGAGRRDRDRAAPGRPAAAGGGPGGPARRGRLPARAAPPRHPRAGPRRPTSSTPRPSRWPSSSSASATSSGTSPTSCAAG